MSVYTFLQKKNNAQSTLNGNITNSSSTVTVNSASSFPTSAPFMATMWNQTSYPDPSNDPNMEVVSVTGITGNVFNITRAQEGTAASAHSTGNNIQLLLTVGQIVEHETQINLRATVYRQAFSNTNLSSGILTATHSLGSIIVNVQVFDNNNSLIVPDSVTLTDSNNVQINLTSFGTLTGTYNLIITG